MNIFRKHHLAACLPSQNHIHFTRKYGCRKADKKICGMLSLSTLQKSFKSSLIYLPRSANQAHHWQARCPPEGEQGQGRHRPRNEEEGHGKWRAQYVHDKCNSMFAVLILIAISRDSSRSATSTIVHVLPAQHRPCTALPSSRRYQFLVAYCLPKD